MLHSIRARLLLPVGLVVAAAVLAVGVLASRITRCEFDRFLAVEMRTGSAGQAEALCKDLDEHFSRCGTWDGADEIIGRHSPLPSAGCDGRMSLIEGSDRHPGASLQVARVVVRAPAAGQPDLTELDPAALSPPAAEDLVRIAAGAGRAIVDASGKPVGTSFRLPFAAVLGQPRREFLGSINRGVLAAVAAAGLLALGLTAVLARRILQPVEELTRIAHLMWGGDLSRRASFDSHDEIGELARSFNAMADSLERVEKLRRMMVDDIAHELRTPLTSIRGQLEALQDGLLPAGPAVIDSLHEDALALQRLVDDLQELALAEAGQLRIEPVVVSVREEVERAAKALWAVPDNKPRLEVEVADDLTVRADPQRLAQVLRNVLHNALTHTPADGRISVTARPLASAASPSVELAVADTGCGIAAGDLPFVFERFFRSDRSRTRATGGSGLGLAIARKLVEAQGGSIRAESPPGAGATFILTFPAG